MGKKIWEKGDIIHFKHWTMGVIYQGKVKTESAPRYPYSAILLVKVAGATKKGKKITDELIGKTFWMNKGKILKTYRKGKLIHERYA